MYRGKRTTQAMVQITIENNEDKYTQCLSKKTEKLQSDYSKLRTFLPIKRKFSSIANKIIKTC